LATAPIPPHLHTKIGALLWTLAGSAENSSRMHSAGAALALQCTTMSPLRVHPDIADRIDPPSSTVLGGSERLDLLRSAAHILVIDDEDINLRLIAGMLRHAGYAQVTTLADARNLEQHLATTPPDLVICDLHMPLRDGFSVITALQPWIISEHLPVLVVSGDISSRARHHALSLGARDFLTKPFDLSEMTLRVRNQLETRLLYQDIRKQNRALLEAIHGRTRELEFTRIEMIERLAIAAEYRDDNTSRHTERVGSMSAQIAMALGLGTGDVNLIRCASPLHDLGKIGIPDALLRKPGSLTADERVLMQTHTIIGANILGGSEAPLLKLAEVIALSHHERWDGAGYPHRLAGEQIPLVGRIVAVADAFDALTNDRPYRKALPLDAAMREILRHRGTQFDAIVVDALDRVIASDAVVA
jgi:putative two-component system response regulator